MVVVRRHQFVVPHTAGPVTGGTLFNRELIRALVARGEDAREISIEQWNELPNGDGRTECWVDSLYLDALPSMVSAGHHQVGLLVHFLPSLLECPTPTRAQLTYGERQALDRVNCFLVTGSFMARTVRNLSSGPSHVSLVRPGCFARGRAAPLESTGVVRAVMVANVLPNKGILPFLKALGERAHETEAFILRIAGHRNLAPAYAAECEQYVATRPNLAAHVEFLGPRSPESIVELLSVSHVMISASIMESFGMALAEARVLGVPLLAMAGGNIASWIDKAAGGELFASPDELANAFLGLCRDRGALEKRIVAARENAIAPRSWHEAASDYLRDGRAPRLFP